MGITHATAATGTDSGDGKISKDAWNEDHVITPSSAAQEFSGVYTLSASGVICSFSPTLEAGRYVVIGKVRVYSYTSAANPGYAYLRGNGGQIGPPCDLRSTLSQHVPLIGIYEHSGGSASIDISFYRESGTTVFGVTGESRFGQSIYMFRI